MKHFITQYKKQISAIAAILFWVAVWQFAAVYVNQSVLLVSPLVVCQTLWQLLFTPSFWQAAAGSVVHILGGFLLALLAGVALAVLAARFGFIKTLLSPLILTVKSVPVASFIILVLLWLGSAKNLAVVISFLMVLPVLYTNTLTGILAADKKLLEMAKLYRVPLMRRVLHIYQPAVMPHFISGCTMALGLCWKSGVAAEVIGITDNSIGGALYNAKIYLSTADLLAWTVVIVLISLCFEKIFMRLLLLWQKRSAAWI